MTHAAETNDQQGTETMDEFYQAAIDLITDPDTDFRGVCIALAKTNPKALCQVANLVPWQMEARRICHAEGKVAAIKWHRERTGMSLVDAKNAIESILDKDQEAS